MDIELGHRTTHVGMLRRVSIFGELQNDRLHKGNGLGEGRGGEGGGVTLSIVNTLARDFQLA